MEINCRIHFSAGAYVTSTVRGQRASSTADAATAAQRLGEKLMGPSFERAQLLSTDEDGGRPFQLWKLISDPDAIAWCWESGLIEIGQEVPEGAIAFARGPERALREELNAAARHGMGKSEGKLLVPGVPEASSPTKKVDALIAWVEWRAQANGKASSYGVVFSRDGEELVA